MDLASFTQRSGNEKRALLYTTIVFVAILLLFFFWKISYKSDVEEGGGGIEVDFGNYDYGLGDDNTSLGTPAPLESTEDISTPTPSVTETTPIVPPVSAPPKTTTTTTSKTNDNLLTSNSPEAIAIKKKQEEAAKKAKAEQAEKDRQAAVAKAQAEAEKKRLAEEARIKKEQEDFKKKMQGGLAQTGGTGTGGTGTGQGQGDTKPGGNQGKPDGSMNGGNGTGSSGGGSGGGQGTGTGSGVGAGSGIGSHTLVGRDMISKPSFINNSNAFGRVMIKISVDKNGNVLTADYTSSGSTTNDVNLIRLSIQEAKKIRFSRTTSGAEKQFGVVTFNYAP